MPQTTVAAPAIGQAGTFATKAPRETTDRVAAEAIPYGSLVVLTDGALTCELPDATTEISQDERRLGVALAKRTAGDGTTEPTGYASGDRVDIALAGEIYVLPTETVAAGETPLLRSTLHRVMPLDRSATMPTPQPPCSCPAQPSRLVAPLPPPPFSSLASKL